jgi:hypothetical protein
MFVNNLIIPKAPISAGPITEAATKFSFPDISPKTITAIVVN